MLMFVLKFILPFIIVTLLYIINIVFLSKETMNNVKLWKTFIIVVNIIALCLSILVIVLPFMVITGMSFGTGLTSITEVELNVEIVMLILMTFGSFIFFIVTNIVLTILLSKKQIQDIERIKLEKNQIKEPIET